MTTLWTRFADLTPAEAEAERADELRRLDAGELTLAEYGERITAWRQAAEYNAYRETEAAAAKAERADAAAIRRSRFRIVR
jgi:hypothetical protein